MYLSIDTYFIFSFKIFFFSYPPKCFKNFNRDSCFKRESFLYREYLLKDHVQVNVLYLISANCLNHNKKVIQSVQQCFRININTLSLHLDLPCTNCNVIFNRVQARGLSYTERFLYQDEQHIRPFVQTNKISVSSYDICE